MHSILLAFAATGLATFAQAFTKPGAQTWGPLLTPDLTKSVTAGETFEITWDPEDRPTDGVTVSLVLCHGPGSNCVLADTAIVEGVPAAQKSYSWSVPGDLAPGKQSTETGYGMLIIVDGTGEFQYSTQFSVLAGKGSGGSSINSSSSSLVPVSTNSAGSVILGPPAQQTGSYTWSDGATTGSGSFPSTKSGSWATSTGTGPAPTGSGFTYDGTTYTSTGSTLSGGQTIPATTTTGATGGSRTSSTSSTVSVSTFPGAADRLNLNVAGLAVAGAVAMFAL